MVTVTYTIEASELRRRIQTLFGYLHVDPVRLPQRTLCEVVIPGLVAPRDGTIEITAIFDEEKARSAPLLGERLHYEDVPDTDIDGES